MKTNTPIEFRFDSFILLNILIKKRVILLITGLIATVISAVVSFIIRPEYKSVAVIFPSPNVLETRSLLNTQNTSTDFFGDEVATEMVLQIIQSDKINDFLINKYDLYNHYMITGNDKRNTLLEKKMKKNITARKTQFNSIEISVLDTDRKIASEIANDITGQVDSVFNSLR
jgi:capsular polysaccharide biosynthesis protein